MCIILLDKGQATAPELARKFEVSVRTIYRDIEALNGAIRERIVQPCKLAYKGMAWYLKAFCTERQDFRVFKLSRILDLEILKGTFSRRDFPGPPDIDQGEYRRITLRFPGEMAYRVYDEFDKSQVQKLANGDRIASAEMPEDAWLIGYLLSFGAQVDIISPTYLKEILAEQAKLIYEKNKP